MKFQVALYPAATTQFLDESQQILRTDASRRAYRQMLRQLQGLHPDKRVNRFTEQDLVAFVNLPGSPNTVAQRRKVVTKFFEWATWRGLVQKDPALGLKRLAPTSRQPVKFHKWLNPEEIRAVVGMTAGTGPRPLRDRTVLLLGLLTGLRRAEMSALTWGDLDLNNRTMRVIGKGQKLATIGLPGQLVEHLMLWRGTMAKGLSRPVAASDRVLVAFHFLATDADSFRVPESQETAGIAGFQGRTDPRWGTSLGHQGVANIVAILGRRAGIPDLAPHDLRRTFAGILEDRGKSVDEISKALRHSNVAVTQKYLEANPKWAIAVTEDLVLEL